jgi:hypothetical protein
MIEVKICPQLLIRKRRLDLPRDPPISITQILHGRAAPGIQLGGVHERRRAGSTVFNFDPSQFSDAVLMFLIDSTLICICI